MNEYGPYRGHPSDPRTPDPPTAVCQNCGTEHAAGAFYDAWMGDSSNFEQDEDGAIIIHGPKDCPACRCSQCGTVTDDLVEDAVSGNPWCPDCIASGPCPDDAYGHARAGCP